MKIVSWNVNGLRAVLKKGFLDWVKKDSPGIICLQEIKVKEEQLGKNREIPGYYSYYFPAERGGYSGTSIFSKEKPLSIKKGIGILESDNEGRTIIAEFDKFFLINNYVPNGKDDLSRVPFKMKYNEKMLRLAEELEEKKPVILVGDFNTAHNEIDLTRAKENKGSTGFLPIERKFLDKLIESGFIDSFRDKNPDKVEYSYWDMKTRARERNVGWRLDYVFVSKKLIKKIKTAFIETEVFGSDHAPAGILIEF